MVIGTCGPEQPYTGGRFEVRRVPRMTRNRDCGPGNAHDSSTASKKGQDRVVYCSQPAGIDYPVGCI